MKWRCPRADTASRIMDQGRQEIGEVVAEFRRARFAHGIECPRCLGKRVHRWGMFAGRHRYRCVACRRTFSDLTGTPAAYLKKPQLLPAYAECLRSTVSVRAAARAVRVAPSTAFRWRHRLLADLGRSHGEHLRGCIELTKRRVPPSAKGQRGLTRPARCRGRRPGAEPESFVTVVIAVDRYANAAVACVPQSIVSTLDLERVIGPKCTGGSIILAAEGRLGRAARFARRRGCLFRDVRFSGASNALDRLSAGRDYGQELNAWLKRFRGVATKYLQNYLEWHRASNRDHRQGLATAVLRWPLPSPTVPANRALGRPGGRGPREEEVDWRRDWPSACEARGPVRVRRMARRASSPGGL